MVGKLRAPPMLDGTNSVLCASKKSVSEDGNLEITSKCTMILGDEERRVRLVSRVLRPC